MSADSHFFFGNPLGFAIQGFAIIEPGQTIQGPFYCLGPIEKPVTIETAVNTFGGNLNGKTLRVSVYGYFESITVSSASTGSLIAYRTN